MFRCTEKFIEKLMLMGTYRASLVRIRSVPVSGKDDQDPDLAKWYGIAKYLLLYFALFQMTV